MDIWVGAVDIVRQRIADNRQLLTDADPQIHYVTEPPERTDDRAEAVPFLQVTERYAEPEGPRMSRAAMYDHLLRQFGHAARAATAPSMTRAISSWTTTRRTRTAVSTTSPTASCSAAPATGSRATPTRCQACAARTGGMGTWRRVSASNALSLDALGLLNRVHNDSADVVDLVR